MSVTKFFLLLFLFNHINAFTTTRIRSKEFITNPFALPPLYNSKDVIVDKSTDTKNKKLSPSEMKLREIQAELRELGVSFVDCFDRDSLQKRLVDARSRKTIGHKEKEQPASARESRGKPFDRDSTLRELRSLRVSELRTQLAARNIRWAGMVEKEELVQALAKAMEIASRFSKSGALIPGKVGDLTGTDLDKELEATSTFLLLDVYATWCGPCQLMAGQMDAVAREFGSGVRVAKIDSDKYPEWASKYRVQGLPTLILFDESGREVGRQEGVVIKDALVNWVNSMR